jgi:hypothetical protein
MDSIQIYVTPTLEAAGFWAKHSGEVIAALAGAIAGAVVAYGLNVLFEYSRRKDQEYSILIESQWAISSQLSFIDVVAKELTGFIGLPIERTAIDLKQFGYTDTASRVVFDKLTFLIEKSISDMGEVFKAQSAYLTLVNSVGKRNELYEKFFDSTTRVIDSSSGHVEVPYTPEKEFIKTKLGIHTKLLFEQLVYACETNLKAFKLLEATLTKLFPHKPRLEVPAQTAVHSFIEQYNKTTISTKK